MDGGELCPKPQAGKNYTNNFSGNPMSAGRRPHGRVDEQADRAREGFMAVGGEMIEHGVELGQGEEWFGHGGLGWGDVAYPFILLFLTGPGTPHPSEAGREAAAGFFCNHPNFTSIR